jgi:hypothetical protein
MRAFDGQRSDNQPVRRSLQQKKLLLRDLKERLAGMKAHTAEELRRSITARIRELEGELSVKA